MVQRMSRHSIGVWCVLALLMSCAATDGIDKISAEKTALSTQALETVDLEGTSNMGFYECADEGPTNSCAQSTTGQLVAFGANGHYTYGSTSVSPVPCAVRYFGDPIPNVAKKCYISAYSILTSEDTVGSVVQKSNVAFGANGRFVFANVTGKFNCSLSTFGGNANDPAPNVKKACYVALPDYTFVADETTPPAEFDLGADPRPVAYGANGKFSFRLLSGIVSCGNGTFGDPISGTQKACYVLHSGYKYFGAEDEVVVPPSSSWCEFIFTSGLSTSSIHRWFDPALPFKCSNETFGRDPAPQERKYCFGSCAVEVTYGGATNGGATSKTSPVGGARNTTSP